MPHPSVTKAKMSQSEITLSSVTKANTVSQSEMSYPLVLKVRVPQSSCGVSYHTRITRGRPWLGTNEHRNFLKRLIIHQTMGAAVYPINLNLIVLIIDVTDIHRKYG